MAGGKLLALVIVVSAVASSWPAHAQCRLCDKPTTVRDDSATNDDVRLEVETTLNFDRLILFGNGDGAAVIRPDGSRAAEGSVAEIGPRAMVGTVVVHGQPGRTIHVELPRRIQLYSLGGGQITFDDVTSDLPSLPRLDSAGDLTFRFGGRLRVGGDTEGDYRGDLPITVEYQ
jgi:uncharacterized protein DUF4402